jgi:DNA excision repair protein ERCC-5
MESEQSGRVAPAHHRKDGQARSGTVFKFSFPRGISIAVPYTDVTLQAAALNKQGNLNDFFDISAGSGTYAPKKRQPYASKRLQKVVSDFRNEQAKRQGRQSHAPEEKSDDGAEASEGPAKKRSKKTTRGATGTSGRVAKSAAQRGGRGPFSSGRKKAAEQKLESGSDADEYGDENGGKELGSPTPLRVKLRPRPKPVYADQSEE